MTFPEKEIYSELITELKAKESYFTSLSHPVPVHYDWDRRQYEKQEATKEFTFDRPALMFQFGRMTTEPRTTSKIDIAVPLTVVCVQNKFVDAADRSANKTAYMKLLEWKYLIHNIINNFKGSCFRSSVLVGIETDHRNLNLHVERLFYTIKGTLTQPVIPPPEDP